MYAPDIKTQHVTIELPVGVIQLVKDSNDSPLTVEQVLAFMIIQKVDDIIAPPDGEAEKS